MIIPEDTSSLFDHSPEILQILNESIGDNKTPFGNLLQHTKNQRLLARGYSSRTGNSQRKEEEKASQIRC